MTDAYDWIHLNIQSKTIRDKITVFWSWYSDSSSADWLIRQVVLHRGEELEKKWILPL